MDGPHFSTALRPQRTRTTSSGAGSEATTSSRIPSRGNSVGTDWVSLLATCLGALSVCLVVVGLLIIVPGYSNLPIDPEPPHKFLLGVTWLFVLYPAGIVGGIGSLVGAIALRKSRTRRVHANDRPLALVGVVSGFAALAITAASWSYYQYFWR